MSIRAYVLLDIVNGYTEYVLRMLRAKTGIVSTVRLAGHPDVIAVIEAPDRKGLVERLMPVISSIDGIAEDLRLRVIQENELPSNHSAPRYSRQAVAGR
jgi:hypothetical protein